MERNLCPARHANRNRCATLNAAVNGVVTDPKIIGRFADDGGMPLTLPRGELAKLLADDLAKWRKIVELVGITPE